MFYKTEILAPTQIPSILLPIADLQLPPVLSFFTGAGFLDIGFINQGFPIVWRNEFNKAFVQGFEYAMNSLFPQKNDSHFINNCNSISEIEAKEILKQAFQNLPKPDVFGIIGGPPCPDFSVGGKNKGSEGKQGIFSQVYVDRILESQPAFFVFENVPGLIKTYKHRLFLINLLSKLKNDYLISIRMLNALEYGVPQDRERIFIIGFRHTWLKNTSLSNNYKNWNDWLIKSLDRKHINHQFLHGETSQILSQPDWFSWPSPLYKNAKTIYQWPTINQFDSIPLKPTQIPINLMVESFICDQIALSKLPNGQDFFRPKSSKFFQIAEGDVSGKSFKRLHRWRYSPAVAYGNNEVHLHPIEPRRLTIREALRIQTVPDEYALPANMALTHKFKIISNGVPVKLAQVVANACANMIIKIRNDDI